MADRQGRDARKILGSVIIKHMLKLSDEETINQIEENTYMQYFVGLPGFQSEQLLAPSLFVEIRRRMDERCFNSITDALSKEMEEVTARVGMKEECSGEPLIGVEAESVEDCEVKQLVVNKESESQEKDVTHQGKLLLDATVAEQAIRYPTDISLLSEGRKQTEQLIELLHKELGGRKPRTYRHNAHRDFLSLVK